MRRTNIFMENVELRDKKKKKKKNNTIIVSCTVDDGYTIIVSIIRHDPTGESRGLNE